MVVSAMATDMAPPNCLRSTEPPATSGSEILVLLRCEARVAPLEVMVTEPPAVIEVVPSSLVSAEVVAFEKPAVSGPLDPSAVPDSAFVVASVAAVESIKTVPEAFMVVDVKVTDDSLFRIITDTGTGIPNDP